MRTENASRNLKQRLQSSCCTILMAAVGALLTGGCASNDFSKAQRLDGFLNAPELLSGPVSVLLTNAPSFSARVVLNDQGQLKSGQLLGSQHHLVYAQDPPKGISFKNHKFEQTSFLWDVSEHKGYVLNDALQGYAPINGQLKTTGLNAVNSGVFEDIDGHRCRRVEKTIALEDGSTAVYSVWEAVDLKGFPVRIKSNSGTFNVTFSKIALEEIPAGMFLLPDGFSKFSSPDVMTSELLERQLRIKNKGAGEWNKTPEDFNSPGGPRPGARGASNSYGPH